MHRFNLAWIIVLASAFVLSATTYSGASEPVSRQQFTERMAKVKEGMPAAEVLAILGKPDDVRDASELKRAVARTRELWCYGTSGHLTFPTLGCIYIDTGGRAQYIHGGKGNPPRQGLLSEQKLRELLSLIDRAPAVTGYNYNPRPVIQIVNALQPLGKERALLAIDEYLRVAPRFDSDALDGGVFLVLRVLFDIPQPPGYMPRMWIGGPRPSGPKDPKCVPRFPILLVDDIPLLPVVGYVLFGEPQRVEEHVQYFQEVGQMRAKPLVPTDQPLRVLDRIPPDVRAYFKEVDWSSREEQMLQDQLFRLIYSVYRKPGLSIDEDGYKFHGFKPRGFSWKQAIADTARLNIHWDTAKGKYTLPDGSTLPRPPR